MERYFDRGLQSMKCIIYLVAYNRPEHLKKTLEALYNSINFCKYNVDYKTQLIVDGLNKETNDKKNWESVIVVGKKFGIDTLIRDKNYGLRNNILQIIDEFHASEFEAMILVEDDIVPSLESLSYFDAMFSSRFDLSEDIFQLSGFSPVNYKKSGLYGFSRVSTWMWGAFRNKLPKREEFEIKWSNFNLEDWLSEHTNKLEYMMDVLPIMEGQKSGKINSWSLDLLIWMLVNNKLTLYPSVNLVSNIGHDGTGVNCGKRNYLFRGVNKIINSNNNWEIAPYYKNSITFNSDAKNYFSNNLKAKFKRLLRGY